MWHQSLKGESYFGGLYEEQACKRWKGAHLYTQSMPSFSFTMFPSLESRTARVSSCACFFSNFLSPARRAGSARESCPGDGQTNTWACTADVCTRLPLLSLLSTSAVAAARASVVFSNFWKCFNFTTCSSITHQNRSGLQGSVHSRVSSPKACPECVRMEGAPSSPCPGSQNLPKDPAARRSQVGSRASQCARNGCGRRGTRS